MLSLWQLRSAPIQSPFKVLVRYATKKASGSRTSNKDSAGRRLGSKVGEGEECKAGQIIYRQRGTRFYPGENVGIGKDHTIYAQEPGFVRYYVDPFHPKRRFIGVALGKEERLPTPHFEPRRRRFGRVEIENPKWAEHDKNWMSRKEQEIGPLLQKEFVQRAAKRQEQALKYQEQLKNFISDESVPLDKAAQRLVEISRYVLGGGRSYSQAKDLADESVVDGLQKSYKFGTISQEEMTSQLSAYKSLAENMDAAVVLHESKVVKFQTEEELAKLASETLAAAGKLVEGKELPLPVEIQKQVRELLDVPCFDRAQQKIHARKFIRRAPPQRLSESFTLPDMNKLVKDGKGNIVPTWNYEARRVEKVFLPNGTPKTSIV